GGGAGEHHGTKLPEIKADALSEREKLYAGMKKIYSKINGLRINQGRLHMHRMQTQGLGEFRGQDGLQRLRNRIDK
ncbi:MAG: hypothetical protein WC999_06670, partial [Hydrogenophaga sp.]